MHSEPGCSRSTTRSTPAAVSTPDVKKDRRDRSGADWNVLRLDKPAEFSGATGPGGTYCGPLIIYQWGGDFASAEVEALRADGFGRAPAGHGWRAQVERHGLGWVSDRRGAELTGFINVAWDGGVHAFILDTMVARPLRRHESAPGWQRSPPTELWQPGASGCTSTSRRTCTRSTSAAAGSGPRTPGSSG